MSTESLPRAEATPTRRQDRTRARPRSSRLVLGCVVGVCLVSVGAVYLVTSRFGIGMISDSVTYLTSAHNLAIGQGFTTAGQPVTVFAPGYSTVLSVGESFGLDVDKGARLLSAAAFAATVVLGHLLLRRHVRSRKVLVAGTIAIGCSAVLLEIFQQAISEHLFLIVVLLFILAAESLFRSPRALFPVSALIVLAWCAFYLRYAGIVFVGIAGLLVLVACWRTGVRSTLVRAAVVAVAGIAVPALWMRRNVDLGTGPLGARHNASASFGTNLSRTVDELSRWLATDKTPPSIRPVLFYIVLFLILGAIVWVVRGRIELPRDAREMLPLVLVVSVYLLYLIITASIVAFAAIDVRFLSPVFVPLIVLAAWMLERAYQQVPYRAGRAVIIGVALAWLVAGTLTFGQNVKDARANGAGGYAIARWHHSGLIKDVRQLDPNELIYSNEVPALELFTTVNPKTPAQKTFFGSSQETGQLASFVHRVSCVGDAKLAWFLPNYRTFLYSPDELAQQLDLTVVKTERDGVLYDVRPLPGAPSPDCAG